jgi:hypothetical protein
MLMFEENSNQLRFDVNCKHDQKKCRSLLSSCMENFFANTKFEEDFSFDEDESSYKQLENVYKLMTFLWKPEEINLTRVNEPSQFSSIEFQYHHRDFCDPLNEENGQTVTFVGWLNLFKYTLGNIKTKSTKKILKARLKDLLPVSSRNAYNIAKEYPNLISQDVDRKKGSSMACILEDYEDRLIGINKVVEDINVKTNIFLSYLYHETLLEGDFSLAIDEDIQQLNKKFNEQKTYKKVYFTFVRSLFIHTFQNVFSKGTITLNSFVDHKSIDYQKFFDLFLIQMSNTLEKHIEQYEILFFEDIMRLKIEERLPTFVKQTDEIKINSLDNEIVNNCTNIISEKKEQLSLGGMIFYTISIPVAWLAFKYLTEKGKLQ